MVPYSTRWGAHPLTADDPHGVTDERTNEIPAVGPQRDGPRSPFARAAPSLQDGGGLSLSPSFSPSHLPHCGLMSVRKACEADRPPSVLGVDRVRVDLVRSGNFRPLGARSGFILRFSRKRGRGDGRHPSAQINHQARV